MTKLTVKSVGHMGTMWDISEVYRVGDNIYLAHYNLPIMTDGRRYGRWECSVSHWERYLSTVYKDFKPEEVLL